MKKTEVLKLVTVTKTLWPNWKASESADELALVVDTWHAIIDDVPADLALAAIHALSASGREFAPPVGVVRQKALALVDDTPDVDLAWGEVRRSAQYRGYAAGPPDWSHPAIAAAVDAIGWRDLCLSSNSEATRAHFFKVYGTAALRSNAERDLPPAARAVAELHVGRRMPELGVSQRVEE